MAKKNKANKVGKEKKEGGKLASVLIVFLIVLIWLSVFALLIRLDVAELGTSLRPYIKDVPVLNFILPPVSEEQLARENQYPYLTMADAIDRIAELEEQLETMTELYRNASNDVSQSEKILELQAEVARLKVYEDNVLAFEERVRRFDIEVVFGEGTPPLSEYRTFYEEIYPETAAQIYEIVLKLLAYDGKIKERAQNLADMKPAKAAEVLEEMTDDTTWNAKVLLAMDEEARAAIMNKMSTLYLAKLYTKIKDLDEEGLYDVKQEVRELLNLDAE